MFVRANDPDVGKFRVFTANADGTNSRALYDGPATVDQPAMVAWSPDGTQIASLLFYANGALSMIQFADSVSGKVRPFAEFNDRDLSGLVWLPNGSGLLTTYMPGSGPPPNHLQIDSSRVPVRNFAGSPRTRTATRHLHSRQMERRWRRYSKKPHRHFISCLRRGSPELLRPQRRLRARTPISSVGQATAISISMATYSAFLSMAAREHCSLTPIILFLGR